MEDANNPPAPEVRSDQASGENSDAEESDEDKDLRSESKKSRYDAPRRDTLENVTKDQRQQCKIM